MIQEIVYSILNTLYQILAYLSQSNPLGDADDLGIPQVEADSTQLDAVLGAVFFVTGLLASVFLVVGGLKYVMSAGNPEAIEKAKNTILYALIGLVVSLFAFTLVNFVIGSL